MLDLATVLSFLIASTLLALVPGPDNIFVLTQSVVHGKSAGIVTTFGLCTGVMVHTLAVAFGVAAIFQASAVAFSLLKYVGAAYLLYLAWKSFRAKGQVLESGETARLPLRRLYVRGIIMNVTNPKVSIFFLAFMPQFADPARGSMTLQFLQLGGLFILSALVVFISFALLAGLVGQCLTRSPKAQTVMNKVAGVVFCGLALKIATAHR